MDFTRLVGSRRSVRWFKSWEPVPKANIQRILEIARWTTCPGNLQPWKAVVVYRDELDQATREELLKADNWQGAHTQAPVWIYWYGDPDSATGECFVRNTYELLDVGAIPAAYGWARDTIKAAIQEGVETPEGMASIQEILHNLPPEISAMMAYSETVGACAVAALAAVDQGLGTCLHTIARPSMQDRVKELLGVPARCMPVWNQLVGFSAESPAAGGQRPRGPFEESFFFGKWGQPFERDEAVVAELTDEGLLQPAAPLPQRWEELRFLARMYGYPED
jgi:nitroreductase